MMTPAADAYATEAAQLTVPLVRANRVNTGNV